jgi:predicted phage terminase large subunit-like protein
MSPWYQSLWAERFQLASDRNLATQFMNNRMGQMIATSTGSGAEGRGGDTAILDDPMSSQQSLSDVERMAANRWVDNTLRQRLNDPGTAAIIVIMQRLNELDTTGFVKSQDGNDAWKEVVIPLEAEKDEEWVFPISGKVVQRKKGDILQPERFTPNIVAEKQRNRMVYAGQYQQRPAPLEGNLIKRSEVKYYGGRDPLTGEVDEKLSDIFNRKVISVDCAFKDLVTSDYVAILAVGVKGRKRFVLNVVNEHLDAAATEAAIRGQRLQHPDASAILVEDKANGPAVIQRLKANVAGVIPVNPQGGKIARMFAVAPEWQAGDWYVDRNAAWAEPFIQQITMFPAAAHDDMVDAMSQAGIYLGGGGGLQIYESWSDSLIFDDEQAPVILFENPVPHYVGIECATSKVVAFVEVLDDGKTAWQTREYYWDSSREGSQKTDAQYAGDLIKFIESSRASTHSPRVILKKGTTGFFQELINHGLWVTENAEDDAEVIAGIRTVSNAFAAKQMRIHRSCANTIREHQIYCWNPEKQAQGIEQPLPAHGFTCSALRRVASEIFQPWRCNS